VEVKTMSEDESRDFLNGKRGEVLKNVTVELPIFDEYGQIVKCEDETQDLCSLCKYDPFKGEHHACYVCAYGEMPEQCYYK
jgi:hypothetical protein